MFDADGLVVDQLGQRVHVAEAIDQHVRPLAGGEDVAHILQRADEGTAAYRGGSMPPSPAPCAAPSMTPP